MLNKIEKALKKYWGYSQFLPLQKQAMTSIVSKRDSLVVLPTGGGKSLCYQAPAAVGDGLAIVVSPLISLMKDQVDTLNECGLAAGRMDSSLTREEVERVHKMVHEDKLKILYVSPERVVQDRFISYFQKKTVSLFAIDEAHCVSMWGHDFRPEYRQLSKIRKAFPGVPIHTCTATANQQVREDIAYQLKLNEPDVFVGSFDRDNLVYHVAQADDRYRQVETAINRHKGESGIIYCISRKEVDQLSTYLNAQGFKTLPYHAGKQDHVRKLNQDLFIKDKVDIIVATIAFGMGIDKSNVRFVIHAGMPKSIENYQQESGRAGRDGLQSHCYLFHSGKDYQLWKFIIGKSEETARSSGKKKLSDIYNFCHSRKCRHQELVEYFGQDYGDKKCKACDVCLGESFIVPAAAVKKKDTSILDIDEDLFNALRRIRKEISQGKGVPAFVIFSDASLSDMAARRPSNPAGFLQIKGVGLKKHKQYSKKFLTVITSHCENNSLEMDI
jgi:ATP-dependent DNA helicase RecQ